MTDPHGNPTPDPEDLPDIAEMLKALTGGELDPQMAESLSAMGLGQVDPAMLQMAMAQVQAMFATPATDGPVNESLAVDTARRTLASGASDPVPSDRDRTEAREAVDVAGLWLDAVTDVAAPVTGVAWSGAEWVEATMPVWCRLVEPVAGGVGDAVSTAMGKQLGELAEHGGIPEGLVPPGMNPAAMMGQLGEMMQRMHGSLFSLQLGQGVGTLGRDVLTGCEVGLPLVAAPTVALLPRRIRELAEGLEIDEPQVRLHVAVREAARTRLFAGVPWLAEQLVAAVRDYASDITIDTEGIEESLRSIDPSDPTAVQEALGGKLFDQQHSPAQAAALQRLETWLALVEGWVDVVAGEAAQAHLPQAVALDEAVRRRRASEGPAAKTFAALVGLELRPRRLRDAANLFAALQAAGGAELRDRPWQHPDLAPDADDLDDPLGYVERTQEAPGSLDAELDALLRGDTGDGPTS